MSFGFNFGGSGNNSFSGGGGKSGGFGQNTLNMSYGFNSNNMNNVPKNQGNSNTSGFGWQNNGTMSSNMNSNMNYNFTEDYKKDIKLDQSVTLPDSISSIRWANPMNGNSPPIFAATCWDKSVRLFQVTQGQMGPTIVQNSIVNLPQPATCLTWNSDNSSIYVGCIDGTVRSIDSTTMNLSQIAKHNAGISSVHYSPQQNVVITTAYEDKIKFWQGNPNPVMQLSVDNKVFVSDFNNGVLAAATANERLIFTDMNMASQGNFTRLESIDLGKFSQIQSISLDKKGETVGLTTFDGRSNISSLTKTSNGFKTHALITFKSNKVEEGGNAILYPTNTSCFNPFLECWFVTGGSDGTMSFWDYKARNKIRSFMFNNPVCCAQVSSNGKMVAYSLGNDWHIGAQGIGKWPNLLGVHQITDQQHKFNGVSGKK